MKLILIILLLFCTGCSPIAKLKDEYKDGITVNAGETINIEDLVETKDDVSVNSEVIGNELLIEASTSSKDITLTVPVSYEPVKIDASTMEVDLNQFFTDTEKADMATYSIGEEAVTITYQDKSFDVPYAIVYPRYEVASDPVIDLYTGYNIEDIIIAPDMEIEHSLDEENSKLNVKLSKGIWSEELSIDVTLVDSNPFPMHYYCHDDVWLDVISNITVYEDGTMYDANHKVKGYWFEDGTTYWDGYPTYWIENFGEDVMKIYHGIRMNGNYAYDYCTLIKD